MAEVDFFEIDTEKLTQDILQRVEDKTGELLYPGDERRVFAEAIAYVFGVFLGAANEQAKSRLLPFAKGYQLDALGERVGCRRMEPTPSTCALRFSLDTPRPHDIIIPAGTMVTSDNNVFFSTDARAVIPAGAMSIDGVAATSTTGGSITAGIPAGAITRLTQNVPYVSDVTNTTASTGGTDGEPYPLAIDSEHGDDGAGDDSFRERIRLAVAGFSTAGGAASYEYHARSATTAVESVSVVSRQAAGTVNIYITEAGGAAPSEGTLALVLAAVTDDAVRPLNDRVLVSAPEPVSYDIELCYYYTAADETATRQAIEGSDGQGGLIRDYIAWQSAKIGRDINPDRLRAFLLDSCVRVDVISPRFAAVSDGEVARWSGKLNVSSIVIAE